MRTRQKRIAADTWGSLGCRTTPLEHWSKRKPTVEPRWAKQQTKKLRSQPTEINSFMSGPSLSLSQKEPKLYSMIKNARQDSQGISAPIHKSQNILVTEQKAKATILNKQFQSVFFFFFFFFFSQLSPLRLGQLCIEKVQEIFEIAPENLRCKYSVMSDIIINSNGI